MSIQDKITADILFGCGRKTIKEDFKSNTINNSKCYFIVDDRIFQMNDNDSFGKIELKEELYSGLKSIKKFIDRKVIGGKCLKLALAYIKDFWNEKDITKIYTSDRSKQAEILNIEWEGAKIAFLVTDIDDNDVIEKYTQNKTDILVDFKNYPNDLKNIKELLKYTMKEKSKLGSFMDYINICNDGFMYATNSFTIKRIKLDTELFNLLDGGICLSPSLFDKNNTKINLTEYKKSYHFNVNPSKQLMDLFNAEFNAKLIINNFDDKKIKLSKIDFGYVKFLLKENAIVLVNKDDASVEELRINDIEYIISGVLDKDLENFRIEKKNLLDLCKYDFSNKTELLFSKDSSVIKIGEDILAAYTRNV